MRKAFHQFFRPTVKEFEVLWKTGKISFDASVLLNIYGYSSETRDELINLIKDYRDRILIPHQFALEYARNRASVIVKQISNYQKVENELNEIKRKYFDPKRDHPYLSKKSSKYYGLILSELVSERRKIEAITAVDPYADILLEVLEGKVGERPDPERLVELHKEARQRYDGLVPPGFKDDKEKPEPDCFGDYIAWSQIMDIAKENSSDFILVIDDSKIDWWHKEGSRTVGPRPELIAEFYDVSSQRIWIYSSEGFLRAAKEYGKVEISDEAIEEVSVRRLSAFSDIVKYALSSMDIPVEIKGDKPKDPQEDPSLLDKKLGPSVDFQNKPGAEK